MKLLEDTRNSQLPIQLIESASTTEATNFKPSRSKLTMTWEREWRGGHQSFVAKWTIAQRAVAKPIAL